jgi:hypothetical protein
MSRTQEERRQFWRNLIAQYEQSGVSVRALCQEHREFSARLREG